LGLAANIDKIPQMVRGIVSILANDPATQPRMRDALAEALISSSCWADSKIIVDQMESIGSITSSNADSIRVALKENSQVSKAFGISGRLEALMEPYPEKVTVAEDDDNVPF